MQPENEEDDERVEQEQRQVFEPDQLGMQPLVLEAHEEGEQDRRRGGDEIVQHDQNLARRQSG